MHMYSGKFDILRLCEGLHLSKRDKEDTDTEQEQSISKDIGMMTSNIHIYIISTIIMSSTEGE